jgi:hypothetical protein
MESFLLLWSTVGHRWISGRRISRTARQSIDGSFLIGLPHGSPEGSDGAHTDFAPSLLRGGDVAQQFLRKISGETGPKPNRPGALPPDALPTQGPPIG